MICLLVWVNGFDAVCMLVLLLSGSEILILFRDKSEATLPLLFLEMQKYLKSLFLRVLDFEVSGWLQ